MKNLLARILLALPVVVIGMVLAVPATSSAAKEKNAAAAKGKNTGPKYARMDYGPFLAASVISDPRAKVDNSTGAISGDSTARGIAIKLSEDWESGVVFDADLLRMSAGWTDGSLKITGVIGDGAHGPSPTVGVPPLFQTPHLPGWADRSGSFKDPRDDSIAPLPPPGPMPHERGRFKGLYRHGERVVLSYVVNGTDILESATLETKGIAKAIARTVRIAKHDAPLELMLADVDPQYPHPEAKRKSNIEGQSKGAGGKVEGKTAWIGELNVAVVGLPPEAALEVRNDTQLVLKIPPQKSDGTSFKVLIAGGGEAGRTTFAELLEASPKPDDLSAMTKGGPSLWKETVTAKGVVGTDTKQPYVVDSITLPHENPYNAWIRPGGFDFFADGTRAAVCTWSGDVWVVSGIDQKLENLTWKRFATGLHQPLGLRIVDDKVYTVGHDQITRLHDLDADGEADFYENFNSDWELTTAFHAFCFDLHTDREGNFYFQFGSPVRSGGGGFHKISQHHGTVLKVSKDGSKLDVYATGFRAPNGMGINVETGQITSGDNEGSWVPKCPLHWIKPGSFNGMVEAGHRELKSAKGQPDPAEQPKPLCWFPKDVDNSGGGQVWVTSDHWGPFKGDLLHTSYGTSSLFKVMYEEVNGQVQGGVAKMPVKFTSSAMRSRFHPKDGQLYVAGLKGWQSNAARDGGFDRVRYTGAPLRMPTALRATPNGMAITFTTALDKAAAEDADNYDVECWNYRWTSGYGSGEYQRETLTVRSAKLSDDGKTVTLEIEGIKPVMQMQIEYNVAAAGGKAPMKGQIHNTIHNLPGTAQPASAAP